MTFLAAVKSEKKRIFLRLAFVTSVTSLISVCHVLVLLALAVSPAKCGLSGFKGGLLAHYELIFTFICILLLTVK